jgi:hypothetical protein
MEVHAVLIPWRTNLKMLFAGAVDAPRRHYEPFMLMLVTQAGEAKAILVKNVAISTVKPGCINHVDSPQL